MTRRGTTGIAWVIGISATLLSVVLEPAAKVLGLDEPGQEELIESATDRVEVGALGGGDTDGGKQPHG